MPATARQLLWIGRLSVLAQELFVCGERLSVNVAIVLIYYFQMSHHAILIMMHYCLYFFYVHSDSISCASAFLMSKG